MEHGLGFCRRIRGPGATRPASQSATRSVLPQQKPAFFSAKFDLAPAESSAAGTDARSRSRDDEPPMIAPARRRTSAARPARSAASLDDHVGARTDAGSLGSARVGSASPGESRGDDRGKAGSPTWRGRIVGRRARRHGAVERFRARRAREATTRGPPVRRPRFDRLARGSQRSRAPSTGWGPSSPARVGGETCRRGRHGGRRSDVPTRGARRAEKRRADAGGAAGGEATCRRGRRGGRGSDMSSGGPGHDALGRGPPSGALYGGA